MWGENTKKNQLNKSQESIYKTLPELLKCAELRPSGGSEWDETNA